MDTDWTSEWTPPAQDLPEVSPETLAAVIELQGGEVQESTRHLFETFEPELTAYFRRHSCQKDEADDLTQTVFIQMLEQIGNLKDPTSFHFWLFKIAGNYLRNFMRDESRSQDGFEVLADKARGESESSAFWMRGSFEPNPEIKLAMSETVDDRRLTLRKLLQATKLGSRTRESLLRRFQGESLEEISRALGISIGTVGSHISRASTALLGKLNKVDLDTISLEDSGDIATDLSSELLMFKREALEADPAYRKAGIFEVASGRHEAEESNEETLMLFGEDEDDQSDGGADGDEIEPIERVVDSPAEIAAVVREDRARGRSRRVTRTVPPAASQKKKPVLERLSEDDLRFPLILLGEAASLDPRGVDGDLALKAKLACAASLLERGRRFKVAREVKEIVRQALDLMDNRQSCTDRQYCTNKVIEGRTLLRSHLNPKNKGDTNHVSDEKQAHRDGSSPRNDDRIPRSRRRSTARRVAASLAAGGGDPSQLHSGLGAAGADDRTNRASSAGERGPALRVRES